MTKANTNPSGFHKPPSRIRYERSHPVVSFRIDRELNARLKYLLGLSGQSIADFFRVALERQEADQVAIFQQGYQRGFEEAKERYLVTFQCCVCDKTIEVTSAECKEIAGTCLSKIGAVHVSCGDTLNELINQGRIRPIEMFQLYSILRPSSPPKTVPYRKLPPGETST